MNLMPDVDQLSRVISEATAPAFVLTAVAGFVSVLRAQLISVVERIRSLNEVSDSDDSRAHLKSDLPRLRKRAPGTGQWTVHVIAPCCRIWVRLPETTAPLRCCRPFHRGNCLAGCSAL